MKEYLAQNMPVSCLKCRHAKVVAGEDYCICTATQEMLDRNVIVVADDPVTHRHHDCPLKPLRKMYEIFVTVNVTGENRRMWASGAGKKFRTKEDALKCLDYFDKKYITKVEIREVYVGFSEEAIL